MPRWESLMIFTLLYLNPLTPILCQDLLELVASQCKSMPIGTELSVGILTDGDLVKVGIQVTDDGVIETSNHNKLFEIGSITKTFTAALIAKQVEEGTIDISQSLNDFLPDDTKTDPSIQLNHLITHTSGLDPVPSSFNMPYLRAMIWDPKNPNRFLKARHYHKYLRKKDPKHPPGQTWEYNNAAYGLLGEITELRGRSWEEQVSAFIFGPLGMTNSYFEVPEEHLSNLVPGITAKGKKAKTWQMDLLDPAGVIKSTVDDMLQYLSAQIDPAGHNMGFLKLTQDPLSFDIVIDNGLWKGNYMGLGWWYDHEKQFMWHAGATGGYTAFVGFSPQTKKAVVILSNISSRHPDSRNQDRIPIPVSLGHTLMRSAP